MRNPACVKKQMLVRFAAFFLMLLLIFGLSGAVLNKTHALAYITPEMFGAVGDGIANDTAAFDAMTASMEESGMYAVLSKCYLVDSVKLPSGCVLLSEGGILKKNPRNEEIYAILELRDNCRVEGLTLIGERDKNYTVAEWGHCIKISGSNCQVKNCTMIDPHGDGIYIRGNNARISGCLIDNAYRNGISVTNGQNFSIENTVIRNVQGTAPQYGIDVEPCYAEDQVSGIISGVHITDCQGGILVYLGKDLLNPAFIQCSDITIERSVARRSVSLYSDNDNENVLLFDHIRIIDQDPRAQSFAQLIFNGNDNPTVFFDCAVIGGSNASGMELKIKNPDCKSPIEIILSSEGWVKKQSSEGDDILVDSWNKNIRIYTNLEVHDVNHTTSVFSIEQVPNSKWKA